MSDSALIVTQQAYVTKIELNNPPMNPIGVAQVAALEKLLPQLAQDKSVRVIVISGAGGKNFSVGANLKESPFTLEAGPKAFSVQRIQLYNQIEAMEKPVIAAIRGYCLGGGMELAMSCHFRVAEEGALLGLPEIDLGVAPMWSGASRALRLVGRSNALDLLLLGRKITAAEALTMNLVNQVASVDDFAESVNQLAQQLAAKAPLAVAAIIRVLNQSQDLDLDKALSVELDEFCSLAGTKDNIEGVTALFEKRKPVFTGE